MPLARCQDAGACDATREYAHEVLESWWSVIVERRFGTQVVCLVLVALAPGMAAADCSEGAVHSWPADGAVLPANGRIVIEGFGSQREAVESIAGAHPRLQYGSHVIPLEVETVRRGQFAISQAVLVHKQAPLVGRTYELLLDPGKAASGSTAQHFGEPFPLVLHWKIGPPLTEAPRWGAEPQADGSQVIQYGCGPARWALVRVEVAGSKGEDSERLLVELAPDDGSARPVTYLVPIEAPRRPTEPEPSSRPGIRVGVGHGMCSGPFSLQDGVSYTARLCLVDLAGHVVPAPGEPLKLTIPGDGAQ